MEGVVGLGKQPSRGRDLLHRDHRSWLMQAMNQLIEVGVLCRPVAWIRPWLLSNRCCLGYRLARQRW